MVRLPREMHDDDHLVEQFRSFFGEMCLARSKAMQTQETDPSAAAAEVSGGLINLIELQTLESRRDGNRFELESIADSRYLKAALADEILLNTQWVGRDSWTSHLLEATLFRSSIAGEKIFERIEQLLSNREPSSRNMAKIYLFALALGFQGKYRGSTELGKYNGYRDELFQFVYQRMPDLSARDRVLSELPYSNTLAHIAPRKLPNFSRWSIIFILIFLGLLAASELLWLWQSWPVRQLIGSGVIF
jgi:type VI secretion system protein ImpK